jgi:hypothetical protein
MLSPVCLLVVLSLGRCRGGMGVATQQLSSADGSWLKTTCMSALSSLVRLQARFSSRLAFLFPDLLKLLENCISQGTLYTHARAANLWVLWD